MGVDTMKKEYIYAGISIFLWSTVATVTKLLLGNLNSMQVLAISSAFAFVFLAVINLIKGNFKLLKVYKAKDYFVMSLVGILGTFLYNLFLFLGIGSMQASQAFIINYLWPMMAVVFACLILKEKFTAKKLIAIVLSFAGVIIVTSNGNFLQLDIGSLTGALYCVLAAVCYGLFTVLNKKNDYESYFSMMIFYLVSFIISAVYMLIVGDSFAFDFVQGLGLLWIGIFNSAIAFTTWALALRLGDTAKISNLAYITPFLSLIWTCVVLKEPFSIYCLIGLIFIVGGILVQLIRPRTK